MSVAFDIEQSRRGPLRRFALWLSRAISTVVYVYFLIVEIILALGFFLLLLGANPTSGFVDWVYRSMDRAMQPFRGIFSTIELGQMPNEVESVFETSVLFAMIVYAILVLAISALVDWLAQRAARLEREDHEYRQQQITEQTLAATMRPDPLASTGTVPEPPADPGTAPGTGPETPGV